MLEYAILRHWEKCTRYNGNDGTVFQASGNFLYHILPRSRRVRPFLTARVGTLIYRGFTSDDESFVFNLGGGHRVRLNSGFSLRVDVRDYLSSGGFGSGTTNNRRAYILFPLRLSK